jgi:hypothetical protein
MFKDTSAKELASKLFSKSEVQNKIAINAVKLIIGDIVTLYGEFRKAEGLGALFFNPSEPNKSTYLTIDDIKKDIILAEEIMDDDLKDFLNKLLNVIDREQEQGTCVVVMVTIKSMSVHVVDLNTVEEHIEELADAFSNN